MKYAQIIFSPTGGTEKTARAFTQNQTDVETIDLSAADEDRSRYVFSSDDIVLIAMPSFGGLAPHIAVERLKQINGGSAKCIVMAVYGNRDYEDTLIQMADAAEECGFRVIAAVAAVAEHSIMHQYAHGRPDDTDREHLADFAERVEKKIRSNHLTKPNIPGNRPYKKAGKVGLVPKADSSCTKCGVCAEACPVQAINKASPATADGKKCISCMRCVAICPQKARSVNKIMVSAAALAIKKACSVQKDDQLFI